MAELHRLGSVEPAEELAPGLAPDAPSEPVAKDDFAYVPGEPLLAILQTVIQEVAEEQRPEAILSGAPEDERRSAGGGSLVSDRQFAGLELARTREGRRAWDRFEVAKPKIFSDPRWVLSGVVIAWHMFKNDRVEFGGLPRAPVVMADDAQVLLVGDWGSGVERAQKVAAPMRAELDAGVAAGREQHVIHLGDVYYTGSRKEYERYFLPYWPVRAGEDIGSFNLAGNHDMYQGGHAYYNTCLADLRFSRQDGRSVFALRSSEWQLLGLDFAHDNQTLGNGQVRWVMDQLAANPRHRTAFLTHHQLFSAYPHHAMPGGYVQSPSNVGVETSRRTVR